METVLTDLYEALEYLLDNADLTNGEKLVASEALHKAREKSGSFYGSQGESGVFYGSQGV